MTKMINPSILLHSIKEKARKVVKKKNNSHSLRCFSNRMKMTARKTKRRKSD